MKSTSTSSALIAQLVTKLEQFRQAPGTFKVFTGFDGFVDRIQKALKRKSIEKNTYFSTIKEFSDHLQTLSGKSGQVEVITEKIKMGGNAPIFANTLGNMGVSSYLVGSMGLVNGLRKEFTGMHPNCQVISIADPGDSRALEFDDGKIILSELGVFDNYNWEYIKNKIGLDALKNMIGECQVVAFVDWVNLPHATNIWEGFLNDIFKRSGRKDFLFLFDLCDPSKKLPQEIDEMLDVISLFSAYGKVTLGLNENEANRIWQTLKGCEQGNKQTPSLNEVGTRVYNSINIDTLLIHPIDRTLIFNKRKIFEMKGRLVTKPAILTGGGDNLNAGYCLGLLLGLEIPLCMILGMATSGAYIEYGQGPGIADLIKYLKQWNTELIINELKSKSHETIF